MSPRTRSPLTLLALAAAALCATAALPAAASAENFGDVVINEFRTHGPGGAADEFIELKNTTNAPINLRPSGSNRMWVVEYWVPSLSDWRYFFFDANRTIPARGRLLLVNKTTAGGGYSLDAYRAGDLVYNPAATGQPDIPTTSGVRLWSDVIYDANMSLTWDASSLNVDEVGAPPHGTDQATQYSYVRKAATGVIQDSDNTAGDFVLVGLNGQQLLNGLKPIAGAPGPQGLGDPLENFGLGFFRIDDTVPISAFPNRVWNENEDEDVARLQLFRTVRNNTGATITTLRIRFIDLTTLNSPVVGSSRQAILYPVSSNAFEGVQTSKGIKTVRGFRLDPVPGPPTSRRGGLNSSMTVALPSGGLPPCSTSPNSCSLDVTMTFEAEPTGSFRVAWWPEVK